MGEREYPIGHKDCPRKAKHTPCPEGYIEWHEWAEKKSKTHEQKLCAGCGTYSIWVRKWLTVPGYAKLDQPR